MSDTTVLVVQPDTTTLVVRPDSSVVIAPGAEQTEIVSTGQAGPQGRVGQVGPQGDIGPTGPQGDIGPTGGNYRHVQSSPLAVWTVVHNLGYRPGGIYVEDSAHAEMKPRVAHVDGNTLTLSFFAAGTPVAIAGEADIS